MKKILLFILISLFAMPLWSQGTETVPLPKSLQPYKPRDKAMENERKIKFLVGGSVGFGVGANNLNFEIAPHFGIFPVIDFLCFGIGGDYRLNFYRDYYSGTKTFVHTYGFNGFVEGYIWDRLILHASYEWLSIPTSAYNASDRYYSNAILVGPGYKQAISDKLSLYGLILFPIELNEEKYVQVYSILDIRVGINYKF
ncbi:MAG: hypothetical protein J5642_00610 [Bacteroidales bacterium]|nr:hypothetical protein [Bacteroidales bacterium]